MLCSQGGIPKNLQCARGDHFFLQGGIPKPTYFAGGINYLTPDSIIYIPTKYSRQFSWSVINPLFRLNTLVIQYIKKVVFPYN
jgi:hypothetical protein